MKRLLFGISLLIYTITGVYAQTAISPRVAITGFNVTYGMPSIRTITPLSETAHYPNSIAFTQGFDLDSIIDEIQYFDGLGRPMQIVQREMSPDKYQNNFQPGFEGYLNKDLVIHQEYDACGRQSTVWLPTVSSYGGAFIPLDILKENSKNLYQDSAYSRPVYEASPLNRVSEQYGPGKRWYENEKSVKTEYLTNKGTSGELSCIWFTVDGQGMNTTLIKKGYYSDAQLYVTKMTNEEGSISYEFKDKLGQVLLTRQINTNSELFDTYYVYDDLGNLSFVIPPIASEIATKGNLSAENLDLYGYQYKYDKRKRCVQKQLPGAKYISYIYDKADRLIFTQDGEQRRDNKNEWLFSLTDAFGRNVLTGICKDTDITNEKYENLLLEAEAKDDGTYRGYNLLVNGQKTSLTSVKVLTVNYYDNYNFLGKHTPNWQFTPKDGYGVRFTGDNKGYETKGLLTGTSVTLLDGSDTFLHSVSYYDNRGRVVQTISSNHLEGEDKTWFAYNYINQVTGQQHLHTAKGKDSQTELYTYAYDLKGRLLKTGYKLNNLTEIVLAENTYNKFGQLESSTPASAPNLKTAYKYNIRSWTETITNNHFKQKLDYDFSGNIHKMAWEQNARNRSYTFEYDKISRLTGAVYKGAANEDYSSGYSYDKHGNMKTLSRKGYIPETSKYGEIDNLTMDHRGNQLISTTQFGATILDASYPQFISYNDQSGDMYAYNNNGAMIEDHTKGMAVSYNLMNQPLEIEFNNTSTKARNKYIYTAAGSKLKVTYLEAIERQQAPLRGATLNEDELTQVKTIDYVSNKIYEDGVLSKILLGSGYYDTQDKKYYFYVQDHLGNNRVVADTKGNVVQSTEYYPFGLQFADGTGQEKQAYKYNGKEFDQMHGLNWYDYSARQYDPVVPYLPTMDPLSEKKYWSSPYAYCLNNPLRFIDPDGMDEWEINKRGMIVNHITTDQHDAFFMVDTDGARIDGQSISFEYGTVSQSTGIFSYETGKGIHNSEYNVYKINGDENATKLFKFAATNTDVEWGLMRFNEGDQRLNYVTTSFNERFEEGSVGLLNDNRYIQDQVLREHIHSHPINVPYPSGLPGTDEYEIVAGDVGLARNQTDWANYKSYPIPEFSIWVKPTKTKVPYSANSVMTDFNQYMK
ncbi:RHS repeat-associated core domain-containing protein [Dysgonomonas sp. HDW5B]|uniref:DUF6443 domain-containing protein n=1 Tax=Dysgonomonas sp. HDW5B TaxID=2714927 RepID=UPI00140DD13C|nr:DUF6443 domain-containing protein [Dysgonomonas sp. HDW5B]QIK52889.1 RHS repeat-associated core domain-containing protein [Dysgonomonas sp. HDW5B]